MNERKFAFIMCSNDDYYLQECFNYLFLLNIPDGYEVDTLVIPDAVSMAAGYNEGMAASDAKYKIYLHQDTFIRNRDILFDIIKIFESDQKIGMIGMIGSPKLYHTGVMWDGKRIGHLYRLEKIIALNKNANINIVTTGLHEVEAIDGLLMITQYDVPWREDIFDGWDFYDVSQCLEFRRLGYRIVVSGQKEAWCIHDCGAPNIGEAYEFYRRKLLSAYPDFFPPLKRFLCVYTDIVNCQHIPWGLLELGHEVEIEQNEVHIQDYDERSKDDFAERLKHHRCDYVITFDLSPEIAQACYEVGVPYIAWSYDSPLKELNGWFATYPTTHAFCMDKKEMECLKKEGKKHTHLEYMHLAGNVSRMQGLIITEEDEKKYSHDISLVGSLYDVGYYAAYRKKIKENVMEPQELKDRVQADIDDFINSMVGDWRRDSSIYNRLSLEATNIMMALNTDSLKSYNIPNQRYYETLLAREITHRDRVRVLKELSQLYDVHLYTGSKTGIPKKVIVHGPVDPYIEAPKVFHLSKINLNISLRSIETGTPLRVFDVMSVGGFMMSNYQRELEDLFVVDKEIVLYESMDELKDKVKFYLRNERARQKIAIAGHEKVKKCYSYPKVLEKIIKIVDSNSECHSR
ncbi:MAG: glycosyltransferase [Lachnospiraceae bacterium]|nr:glycosyltransferase [Lachnospiraceae bacterium]